MVSAEQCFSSFGDTQYLIPDRLIQYSITMNTCNERLNVLYLITLAIGIIENNTYYFRDMLQQPDWKSFIEVMNVKLDAHTRGDSKVSFWGLFCYFLRLGLALGLLT